MSRKSVYKSKQQALFEAWLQDGFFYKQNESYYVVSRQEAKNRIKKFMEKKDFATVKDIAEQLKSQLALSDKNISKSLRVSFVSYAKLVELALKQKTTLSTLVRNMMVKHLRKFLANATKRKDIASEHLNLFRNTFETWQKDSLEAEKSPKDSYSPSMIYYPYLSKELLNLIVEKAIEQVRKKCSALPSEVIDKYLEVDLERTINELHEDWPEILDQNMRLNDNEQLVLDVVVSPWAIIDMNLEEYAALDREISNQYGSETIQTLKEALDIDEAFFDDETEKLPIFFRRLNLISIPIAISHGALLIDNVVLKDEHSHDEIELRYKEKKEKQSAILKSRLDKALKQEDWDVVSTLSDDLVQVEKDYQLQEYSLEIAFKLFQKTQVISFRAPEVIVRAWEAYGKFEQEGDVGESNN